MMRILMIGGTGTISSAITRQLAESEHELWLLNRGNRQAELPAGVNQIVADVEDEQQVAKKLGDMQFDVVCEFTISGCSVAVRASMSTSVRPQPTTSRPAATSSTKERRWPTPTGSTHATRSPAKSC